MTKEEIYNKLFFLNILAWRDDDRMEQSTLFDLQDELAKLTYAVANECGKTDDFVKGFPFLFGNGEQE